VNMLIPVLADSINGRDGRDILNLRHSGPLYYRDCGGFRVARAPTP
jgi:hypothetical protein